MLVLHGISLGSLRSHHDPECTNPSGFGYAGRKAFWTLLYSRFLGEKFFFLVFLQGFSNPNLDPGESNFPCPLFNGEIRTVITIIIVVHLLVEKQK